MSRLIMFVGIFFIIPIYTMEIIKKKKPSSLTLSPAYSLEKIFLIKEINLDKDIIKYLLHYTIWLENKYFEQNFNQIESWKDFRIPLEYHYYLTSDHLNILSTYFKYVPKCITDKGVYELYYILSSKNEYKNFLTIPYELREYLTKLPDSHLENVTAINAKQNLIINPKKTVYIEKTGKKLKEKPILPKKKVPCFLLS